MKSSTFEPSLRYSNTSRKTIPQRGTALRETFTNIIGTRLRKSQPRFTISKSITSCIITKDEFV